MGRFCCVETPARSYAPSGDFLLLIHGHFDHVLGIRSRLSTLGLQQSAEAMTIYGGPGAVAVIVRMIAGL
jgi:ribonuclease Z